MTEDTPEQGGNVGSVAEDLERPTDWRSLQAERALKSRPGQEEKVVKGKENTGRREGAFQFQAKYTLWRARNISQSGLMNTKDAKNRSSAVFSRSSMAENQRANLDISSMSWTQIKA